MYFGFYKEDTQIIRTSGVGGKFCFKKRSFKEECGLKNSSGLRPPIALHPKNQGLQASVVGGSPSAIIQNESFVLYVTSDGV